MIRNSSEKPKPNFEANPDQLSNVGPTGSKMRLGLNWIRLALTAWTMTITKLTQTWVECYHLVSLIGLKNKVRVGLGWVGLALTARTMANYTLLPFYSRLIS